MLSFEDKYRIEELLRREAHLLDERRFREWLDLFTDDVEYLIPLTEAVQGDVAPAGHPIIKDDKDMLLARILKDESGFSHAETPTSMTCHLVGNIVVDESTEEDAEVRSAFIVRQARKLRDEAWWVGRRKDLVRRVNDQWRIARREITLDTTLLPRGISIFF
ncbi:aromatic-ring-hydroxylating dioxygenase subunit beta [Sphaerimonospora cavernae]|uniref:Aromatic-ring-hydroxylating dioxygenase subunit beta n=1 Tax=Sphaerimonospora cavernae TaxID=1740611 RepID=A0ABV6U1L0_9ACTN